MRKIGHRGAAGYELENTTKSIRKALELRVDMIELDVRQCATGELVIFHDSTLERVTGVKGAIKKMSFEHLHKIHTIDGQKILTLTEALHIIDGKCWVNLHLKSPDAVHELINIIRHCVPAMIARRSGFKKMGT